MPSPEGRPHMRKRNTKITATYRNRSTSRQRRVRAGHVPAVGLQHVLVQRHALRVLGAELAVAVSHLVADLAAEVVQQQVSELLHVEGASLPLAQVPQERHVHGDQVVQPRKQPVDHLGRVAQVLPHSFGEHLVQRRGGGEGDRCREKGRGWEER